MRQSGPWPAFGAARLRRGLAVARATHAAGVGGALGLGIGLWVVALFVAPIALGSPHRALSLTAATVYAAGSQICHQRPERSFHVAGRQMPVCARCTGLYISAAAGVPFALLLVPAISPRRARTVLLIAALPTLATWALEYAGLAHFSNTARALCALPLGFVAAWLVASSALGLTPATRTTDFHNDPSFPS